MRSYQSLFAEPKYEHPLSVFKVPHSPSPSQNSPASMRFWLQVRKTGARMREQSVTCLRHMPHDWPASHKPLHEGRRGGGGNRGGGGGNCGCDSGGAKAGGHVLHASWQLVRAAA